MRTPEQKKAYDRAYYTRNREAIIRRSAAHHKAHRTEANAKQRASYARTQKWTKIPGWTKELFDSCLKAQDGRCAICLKRMSKPVRDHNHETNQPRGLLCDPCNRMLGAARERPNTLCRAVVYLLQFNNDERDKDKYLQQEVIS